MLRVFDYRLYPTPAQERSLSALLESLRLFYNAALQERRDDFCRAKEAALVSGKKPRGSVSLASQEKAVKHIKALCPEYDAIHTHLYQDALSRLDEAFRGFFRRVKAGQRAGYPRFKSFGRYTSFTFKDAGNGNRLLHKDAPLRRKKGDTSPDYPALPALDEPTFGLVAGGKRLALHGLGKVKIKLHRPYEGKVKQVRVVHKSDGHWYAQFVCDDVPKKPLPATGQSVGVDVGLSTFAAMSDGTLVPNPRFREAAQKEIATKSRAVARRVKGSAGRKEAVAALAKTHARVRAQRTQFHHKTANAIVAKYDAICVEELNVKGLARGMLAKQVNDAGWSAFLQVLANKAECAGREFVKVDARGTSQECSECGTVVRKGLHVRVHRCPNCGLEVDRDVNAARNVKGRGTAFVEGRAVGSPGKREAPSSALARWGSCHIEFFGLALLPEVARFPVNLHMLV